MSTAAAKCSLCKHRVAFFQRSYSGEKLCKQCFSESIENKVRATITRYKMLNYNDTIAIAVSGGKDSISLLHVLASMERKFPRASLFAVTVDEGIKGYRDEALGIVVKTCKDLDIKNHVVSFKSLYGFTLDELVWRMQDRKVALTPCAFCGVLRRKALNAGALAVGANKIATAHTLDDEVQTSLLNIFHGDVARLASEKPVTDLVHPLLVQKVKPFCEIPEKESALYAYIKGLDFQSTPCPYASEAMRNDIRVLLNQIEERHAGTKFTVFRSIEKLRPALIKIAEKGDFNECTQCGAPSVGDLCMACQLINQIR
ncbi:MAG: TIGR00269 family protein [Candidatus Bathyarchaeota archaeon]|nr:TIGR00269 family protein [Candidatus Bathyarchaeota archaeon]